MTYVFEEPEKFVRTKKFLKITLILIIIAIIFWGAVCFYIIRTSDQLSQEGHEYYFDRRPDLITVFTGDTGRIQYALQKSQELKQPNVFISGVYSKNNVQTLINALKIDPNNVNTMYMELDYLAKNTLGNTIFTYKYLMGRKDIKDILVISNDYHLPRIKMIFDSLAEDEDERHFHYQGVSTSYSSWRNFKVLCLEAIKLLRMKAILLLWSPQIEDY